MPPSEPFALVFETRVRQTLESHAMLPPDPAVPVLVGVSGGADSVSLVRALTNLKIPIGVAHFDHGWRGAEATGDGDFVEDLASRLGIAFHRGRAESGSAGRDEAAARQRRLSFLHQTADNEGFGRIALAHTANDRAETFLLNLVRGAGGSGLSSMRPVSGMTIRPLIAHTREEVERYLNEIGQEWREDPTNRDTRFARNHVRHRIVPELRQLNPRFDRALGRTMAVLEDENAWMDGTAEAWLAQNLRKERGEWVLPTDALGNEHPAMVRRILRLAIDYAQRTQTPQTLPIPRLDGIGLDHVEAVRGLLDSGKSGKTIQIPGPIDVERSFGCLRFFPSNETPADYDLELPIPGRIEIPAIGCLFEAKVWDRGDQITPKPNIDRVFVDGESVGPCVRIRNWQKGDLYDPEGTGASTLKALFQEKRIPWRRRLEWPVVVAGSSIVWVASFPVSREFAVTERSRNAVELLVSGL